MSRYCYDQKKTTSEWKLFLLCSTGDEHTLMSCPSFITCNAFATVLFGAITNRLHFTKSDFEQLNLNTVGG